MSVQIATRVSDELGARLRVLMEREQRSMGAILRLALVAYADRADGAVERASSDAEGQRELSRPTRGPVSSSEGVRSAAPAEQPEMRGLGPVKGVPRREFRPYPKGGK